MSEILGSNSNDLLTGTDQGDVIRGYQGDDTIDGRDGNDVIYGGGSLQQLDTNGIVVTNGTTAHIELESIAKGFLNTVGMYKIASDGSIHDVDILFSPEGGKGGGQDEYPNTSIDVELAAGEQLGFFVLGNGYGTGKNADLLNDQNAQWELRTNDGDAGLIVDTDLVLWHVDPVTGDATEMANGNGHEIMHSVGTADNGYAPNPDGVSHAVAIVDTSTGTVQLGLEAQKNGGDQSFDDAVITIELGVNNVEGLADALEPLAGSDDDVINAGSGDDTVYGQAGEDQIAGEDGEDHLFGGTGNDELGGDAGDDTIEGGAGNDSISGGTGNDLLHGNGGDDAIDGGSGNDVIFGGKAYTAIADDAAVVATSNTARVTFMGESAGYKNTVGVYKIAEDGTIHDVQILFANASAVGSGGDLTPGNSSRDVKTGNGDRLGFFILSNGYNIAGNQALFEDTASTFEFRSSTGQSANINDGVPVTLVHIDAETGAETIVLGKYQTDTYHSIGSSGSDFGLNADGVKHVRVEEDPEDDSLVVAFEDLKGGGDKDYDDAVLKVEFLNTITALDSSSDDAGQSSDNDTISGGAGNDYISGGKGDDIISGDEDHDELFGDSGNDFVSGGDGNDTIKGGTDNDAVYGGDGDDDLSGGKDDDMIYGEAGNDTIFGDTGNDTVDGGDDDDTVMGGEGDDEVYGGTGNDTITGGKGNDVLDGGGGNDNVDADSGNDIILASQGNDYYDGGTGTDLINYSAAVGGVVVNLKDHTATSDLGSHEIWSVEDVIGSAQNDHITGDKRENALTGGEGDDWLRGGKGNDELEGGSGADTYSWTRKDVTGDNGDDNFVDVINGFDSGDVLDLSALTELAGDQQASDVVQLTETNGDTTVAAFDADSAAWVDIAVLNDITGLTVEALDADGQLIV